jgi:hypothetical protein
LVALVGSYGRHSASRVLGEDRGLVSGVVWIWLGRHELVSLYFVFLFYSAIEVPIHDLVM